MSTSDVLRENIAELTSKNYDVVEIQIGEERLKELFYEYRCLSGFSSWLVTSTHGTHQENKFMGIPVKTSEELGSAIVLVVERKELTHDHRWADDCKRAPVTPADPRPQKKFCPYCGAQL